MIDQLASCRLLAATNRSTQQLTGEPLGGRQLHSLLLTSYGAATGIAQLRSCDDQPHSQSLGRRPPSVTAAPTSRDENGYWRSASIPGNENATAE